MMFMIGFHHLEVSYNMVCILKCQLQDCHRVSWDIRGILLAILDIPGYVDRLTVLSINQNLQTAIDHHDDTRA